MHLLPPPLQDVPMLGQLLLSGGQQHAADRRWMLQVGGPAGEAAVCCLCLLSSMHAPRNRAATCACAWQLMHTASPPRLMRCHPLPPLALQLLVAGLRTADDAGLYRRQHAFELAMSLHDSCGERMHASCLLVVGCLPMAGRSS